MTRPAARPGRRALAAILAAGMAATCAALTLAARPEHPPARPAEALAAFTAAGAPAARAFSPPPAPGSPSASPSPDPAPSPGPASGGSPGCGFLDVSCKIGNAITAWFAGLARDALNPLLRLTGQTLLSTPPAAAIPAVRGMWAGSLAIADSAYVLLVIIGGAIVMGHETLQTSYSAKDIAPRLVIGFVTANLSLVLISRATAVANALSASLAGQGVNPSTAAAALRSTLDASLSPGGIFLVLLALMAAALALVLALVYILRLMAMVVLTAAAPLALACYALPQTAWAARWWWRALIACLAIQAAQALVLTAAVRVFFSAGWITLDGASSSLLSELIAICLLYIMMRIPWWITRPVLASFGPSPIRRAVRFAFYAAVLSRVRPALSGAAGGRRPPAGSGGRGGGPAPPGGGPGGDRPAGPSGAGPRRPPAGRGPQPGGAAFQAGSMPAAGGAAQRRQPPGPGPQPGGGPRRGTGKGGAGRGGTSPRPSPAAPDQARPLPGVPRSPRSPRSRQPALPLDPQPRLPGSRPQPGQAPAVPGARRPGR